MRPRKRRPLNGGRRQPNPTPATPLARRRKRMFQQTGWGPMGFLLLICGGVLAWYFPFALSPPHRPGENGQETASPDTQKAPANPRRRALPSSPLIDPQRFDFYRVLPEARVTVTEQASPRPRAVSEPGTYLVQAGVFSTQSDADKVKARLALLGLVGEIQPLENQGKPAYRVRIGPINNPDELNRTRTRLGNNNIEFLVIPIAD